MDLMINVDKAKKLLMNSAPRAKDHEYINLDRAADRVLAQTIRSQIDLPTHDNSAVDGYAFNFENFLKYKKFKIVGESLPGKPFLKNLKSGQAIKIYTGALILNKRSYKHPINTVVMKEEISEKENTIKIKSKVEIGQNIRRKGEDIIKKQIIFKKGTKLRAVDLGYLSSVGINKIKVFKKLKIGIFSSGNEINLSKKKKKYMIFDSNKISLITLFKKIGCEPFDCGVIKDNYKITKVKIEKMSKKFDILVTSGGISSSDTDVIKKVIKEVGKIKFSKISLKPGRPFTFALVNNKPFLGLPGNPVAVIVVFLYFLVDFVNKIYGIKNSQLKYFKVRSNFNFKKKRNRRELLRGYLLKRNDILFVERYHTEGSGILSSIANSDGLVELKDSEQIIKKGSLLNFYSFESLLK